MKKEMIFLIIAGILYGTVISGGQILSNSGLSSYEISFSTMLIEGIVFFFLMILMKQKISPRDVPIYIAMGFVNAVSQIVWTGAVVLGISVAMVTLLLYTQPIWTLLLSWVFFKEKITKINVLVLCMVFVGILFLVHPWNTKGTFHLLGLIFAFLSGPLFSVYLLLSKKVAMRKTHYSSSIFGHVFFTLIWLLLILPFYQPFIHNSQLSQFNHISIMSHLGIIIAVGAVTRVFPIMFLFKSLLKIKASTVGVVLLLEPVSGTILAFFLFRQAITIPIVLGGLLIISANYLVIKKESLVKNNY